MNIPGSFCRPVRAFLLGGLVLLLACTACETQPGGQRSVATPTPPSATMTFPACRVCDLGSVPGVRPFLDTWNNIHLFLSFDYNIPHPSAIAPQYDFVWGADPENVAAFRAANPRIFISYYIPMNRDSGTFADQSATHDLDYWKRAHPDWILYRCDRVTPAYLGDEPNIPFDFTDPAIIAWQIQAYARPASTSGYDGIAADNVNLENLSGACGYYHDGAWVQRYSGQTTDPQWAADVLTWLTLMQQQLHRLPHPLALVANLSLLPASQGAPHMQQFVQHIDALLDEGGFTIYTHGYVTDEDWVARIQFMRDVQAMNKPYYLVNQFNTASINSAQVQWALASYLMGKEHASAVFISTRQNYGSALRYREYDAQIGYPLDEMYLRQNLYFRDYSHGLVIANPSSTHTYRAALPAGRAYADLYGHAFDQALTLPPHSAMVLVTTPHA